MDDDDRARTRGDGGVAADRTRPEAAQRRSWDANAEAWTRSVRSGAIASRERGTNRAVVDAVRRLAPETVLDLGCGEGWLTHVLARAGCDATGVDAAERLIRTAREGPGRFERVGYDELVARPQVVPGPFDVVVCNFSLLDEDLVPLLGAVRARLAADRGRLVIQTVHPCAAMDDGPYQDGWREERFEAFGPGFTSAMPWYARTLASWFAALAAAHLGVERLEEPAGNATRRPLSLLLTARPAAG